MIATISTAEQKSTKYGESIKCELYINELENPGPYTAWVDVNKPEAQGLGPAATVEVTPKKKGNGYFIDRVVNASPKPVLSTPVGDGDKLSNEAAGALIKKAAGVYVMAYRHIMQQNLNRDAAAQEGAAIILKHMIEKI